MSALKNSDAAAPSPAAAASGSIRAKLTRACWELFVSIGCPAIGAVGFFALAKSLGWY